MLILDTSKRDADRLAEAHDVADPIFRPAAFLRAAIGEERAQRVMVDKHRAKMARLAQTLKDCQERAALGHRAAATIEGIGQHTYRIPKVLHAELIETFGPNCFSYPEFRRDFEREFPDCKVPYKPRKASIVMPRDLRQARPAAAGSPILIP